MLEGPLKRLWVVGTLGCSLDSRVDSRFPPCFEYAGLQVSPICMFVRFHEARETAFFGSISTHSLVVLVLSPSLSLSLSHSLCLSLSLSLYRSLSFILSLSLSLSPSPSCSLKYMPNVRKQMS